MLKEVVTLLAPPLQQAAARRPPEPPPLLVDMTLGLAGHSIALLRACPAAWLLGFDRDPEALVQAAQSLKAAFPASPLEGERAGEGSAPHINLVCETFDRLEQHLLSPVNPENPEGTPVSDGRCDAVLFDLGVSSLQLDREARGFAYRFDAPLDMRMGDGEKTAADLLNKLSEAELSHIFHAFGEERYAPLIARKIVAAREQKPLSRTGELVQLIENTVPRRQRTRSQSQQRHSAKHPARRVFQALRIAVNEELKILGMALPQALRLLRPGGRLAVLSYHSLEDRLVKQTLRGAVSPRGSELPPGLPLRYDSPLLQGRGPTFRLLGQENKKPSEAEIRENPRAGSAVLRCVERVS